MSQSQSLSLLLLLLLLLESVLVPWPPGILHVGYLCKNNSLHSQAI